MMEYRSRRTAEAFQVGCETEPLVTWPTWARRAWRNSFSRESISYTQARGGKLLLAGNCDSVPTVINEGDFVVLLTLDDGQKTLELWGEKEFNAEFVAVTSSNMESET